MATRISTALKKLLAKCTEEGATPTDDKVGSLLDCMAEHFKAGSNDFVFFPNIDNDTHTLSVDEETLDEIMNALQAGKHIYFCLEGFYAPFLHIDYSENVFLFGDCYNVFKINPVTGEVSQEKFQPTNDFIINVDANKTISSASINGAVALDEFTNAITEKRKIYCVVKKGDTTDYYWLPYVAKLSNLNIKRFVFSNGSITIIIGTYTNINNLVIKAITPALPLLIWSTDGNNQLYLVTVDDSGALTATQYTEIS